ncbi:MAG: TonB-dependent receptor, partial [Spirochaetota bacterium]
MRSVIFSILLCSLFFPLYSQTKKVFYHPLKQDGGGKPFDPDKAFTAFLQSVNKDEFSLQKSSEPSLSATLALAKKEKAYFVYSGFYNRNKFGTLDFYVQIYNPETGYMIDALKVSDDLDLYEGIELEQEEFQKQDAERIRDLNQKLIIKLKINEARKERKQNIQQNYSDTRFARKYKLPIKQESIQEAAKQVFKFIEDQVVVTATRSKTKLKDTPAAVYVITQRQIRERGYRTLSDALYDLPGFDYQHTYGVYPDLIHQRGLIGTMQRTLLYVDGIPDNNIFENAMLGGTVRFPLNNVERIEVVSGPASALYGANAFNGIINIITKDGKQNPGHHVDATYGTWEKNFTNPGYAVSASARGNSGDFQYSIGAYYYQTQGPSFSGVTKLDSPNLGATDANPLYNYNYDPYYYLEKKLCGGSICNPGETAVGYYSSPFYNNSREDTYNITARFSYKGLRFETINWQYLAAEGLFGNGTQWIDTKQRGIDTNSFDLRNNARRLGVLLGYLSDGESGFPGSNWDVKNNSLLIGYTHEFTDTLSLDSEFIVRSTEILNSSKDSYPNVLGPGAYYRPGDYETENSYDRPDYAYLGEERLSWNPNEQFATIVGVVGRHFVAAKDYGSTERYTYNNYAFYIQQLYKPIYRLRLTAGYRYDYITSYGSASTPRISAVYSATKNLTLKFLAGTAFREPSGEELFSLTPQRRPNESLKPELLRSFEFGVGYRFLKNYYISVQSYYNSISNLILEIQTQDFAPIQGSVPQGGNPWNQYQNIGKARIFGSESEFRAYLSRVFTVNVNYTYSKGFYYDLPSSLQQSPSTVGRPGDNIADDVYKAVYKSITGNDTVISEGEIPNIATHKAYLGLTYYVLTNLSFYSGVNIIGIRKTVSTNPEKVVPGYRMFKINIHWEDFWKKGMYCNLLVNNATNMQFFDPGIRVADGTFYPTMHPLERRNIWFTLGYVPDSL